MTSCKSTSAVRLVDESNNPIFGAVVVVQGMSIQGHTLTTDKEGQVVVNIQEIVGAKWVVASKSGYDSYVINLSEPWPEVVVLKQSVTPNKALKQDK